MNTPPIWLLPDACLSNGRFLTDHAVLINPDGRIGALKHTRDVPSDATHRRLPHRALMPGFVNAHSHAFQRAMRGTTEHLLPGHEADDFWSWRAQMYALANTLTPETLYPIAKDLYTEMLAAGYTAVGEFHYLHHASDGQPHPDTPIMARTLIQAAKDAGIRITLLVALYAAGGLGEAPTPGQRRFISPDLSAYLTLIDPLLRDYDADDHVQIGLAPHSIRAVPLKLLRALADWNRAHRLPVHMHVCEQVAEIQQTQAHLGVAPIEAIATTGLLNAQFVGIHATHLEPDDPNRLRDAGATVCACPTTEANLGDGFLPAHALMTAGVPIAIGSDSHAIVNPMEELRQIENNERLQKRRRAVLAGLMQPDSQPGPLRIAPGLLESGTHHGARALNIAAGRITPGAWADLIALDLNDPYLKGVARDHLPEALVFSAGPRAIAHTWVGGREVWSSGKP